MRDVLRSRHSYGLPIALAAVLVLATSTGVAARIHPGNAILELETAQVTGVVPGQPGRSAKRSAACPVGYRAITGGAYWHLPGQNGDPMVAAYIKSTAPLTNGRGWYASGLSYSETPLELTVTVQCLAERSFAAYSVHTREVIVDPQRSGNADLRCAADQKVVMGGGAWRRPNHAPEARLKAHVSSSWPDADGLGWSVAGRNEGATVLKLRVTAFCVPSAATGSSYHLVSFTHGMDSTRTFDHYLFCAKGERVLGGGAFWSTVGDGLHTDTQSRLVSSTANGNGLSWYAAGYDADFYPDEHDFSEWAICLAV